MSSVNKIRRRVDTNEVARIVPIDSDNSSHSQRLCCWLMACASDRTDHHDVQLSQGRRPLASKRSRNPRPILSGARRLWPIALGAALFAAVSRSSCSRPDVIVPGDLCRPRRAGANLHGPRLRPGRAAGNRPRRVSAARQRVVCPAPRKNAHAPQSLAGRSTRGISPTPRASHRPFAMPSLQRSSRSWPWSTTPSTTI